MFKIIAFLQKRPKDSTILIGKIVFGLLIIGVLYYNFFLDGKNNNQIKDVIFGQTLTANAKLYLKYIMIGSGIIPVIMGIINICLMKKKYVRIMQIVFGIVLMFFSSFIKPVPQLDINNLIFILAFLPLFAGITGKCITKKCLKYGEVIKKIRV